jgi:integration host factor subunit alpha
MTLTKSNIAEAIQNENGYSKDQALEIVETLIEIIKKSLESGDDVLIVTDRNN